MSNKVELKENEMNSVMGGIAFENFTNTIGEDEDHMIYHYKDINACLAYYNAHCGEYTTVESRNKGIIAGMLAEGLIY